MIKNWLLLLEYVKFKGRIFMNYNTRGLIDKIANGVLNDYNIEVPIKDMQKVIQELGGQLKVSDNVVDGKIEKDPDKGIFIISIKNGEFNSPRNRFTIAHELGHLFLHMGYGSSYWDTQSTESYQRLGTSKDESEANEFAAAFLMPEALYKSKIWDLGINNDGIHQVNIEKIADFFKVSTLAAVNRGKFLGVFEW